MLCCPLSTLLKAAGFNVGVIELDVSIQICLWRSQTMKKEYLFMSATVCTQQRNNIWQRSQQRPQLGLWGSTGPRDAKEEYFLYVSMVAVGSTARLSRRREPKHLCSLYKLNHAWSSLENTHSVTAATPKGFRTYNKCGDAISITSLLKYT